jgi:hypothetical protein
MSLKVNQVSLDNSLIGLGAWVAGHGEMNSGKTTSQATLGEHDTLNVFFSQRKSFK